MGQVDIVIVNWNTGNLLRNCLYSIGKTSGLSELVGQVIVVDNASTDTSLENLQSLNYPVNIIKNEVNLGFAKACNLGAEQATSKYILFLNPDTELLENTLIKSINFYENNNIGILGVQLLDESKNISLTCRDFPTFKNIIQGILGGSNLSKTNGKIFDHRSSCYVEQVIGAYFFLSLKLFYKVGGFDERFFVYYEEADFSFRAFKLGYKSYYCSEISAIHVGGGSSNNIKPKRIFYRNRSQIFYAFKNFSLPVAITVFFAVYFIEPLARLGRALISFNLAKMKETLLAYQLMYANLYKIIQLIYRFKNDKTPFSSLRSPEKQI